MTEISGGGIRYGHSGTVPAVCAIPRTSLSEPKEAPDLPKLVIAAVVGLLACSVGYAYAEDSEFVDDSVPWVDHSEDLCLFLLL